MTKTKSMPKNESTITPSTFVDRYFQVTSIRNRTIRSDKLRGWNRSVTCYVKDQPRSQESRIRSNIKSQITRRGGSTEMLTW